VLRRQELSRQLDVWGGTATWSAPTTEEDRDRAMATWLSQQTPRFGYPPADQ
jgi:hypothetical protein